MSVGGPVDNALVTEISSAVSDVISTNLADLRDGVRDDIKKAFAEFEQRTTIITKKAFCGEDGAKKLRHCQSSFPGWHSSGSQTQQWASTDVVGPVNKSEQHEWTRRARRIPTWMKEQIQPEGGANLDDAIREAFRSVKHPATKDGVVFEVDGGNTLDHPHCVQDADPAPLPVKQNPGGHEWTRRHMRSPTLKQFMYDTESEERTSSLSPLSPPAPVADLAPPPIREIKRLEDGPALPGAIADVHGDPHECKGSRSRTFSAGTSANKTYHSESTKSDEHVQNRGEGHQGMQFKPWLLRTSIGRMEVMDGTLRPSYSRGKSLFLKGKLLKKIVASSTFESVFCFLIFINALSLGAQTDYEVQNYGKELPPFWAHLERAFTALFILELCLRMAAFKAKFFTMRGWQWNLFDLAVIISQVFDEIATAASPGGTVTTGSISTFRILRLMRLVRVLRVARVLKRISELRTLVVSILSSVKSLMWTLVLFLVMIYILSLSLTQIVADYKAKLRVTDANYIALDVYYGSLGSTMLSLFMAITGGTDWEALCMPLMDEITPVMGILFSMYVAFAVLAMLNVVTGVFVESVLKSQAADRDLYMANNARELFEGLEGGAAHGMTWDTFSSLLEAPQMVEFFKAIDVDPSDAHGLFTLLDIDASGEVSAEEFLAGALRLRGPSKALDTALLLQEVKSIRGKLQEFSTPLYDEGYDVKDLEEVAV